jgi:glycerol kinase
VPVTRAANTETTAMGAAYRAGLAVDYYRSMDEISSQWASDRKFGPTISAAERERLHGRWHKALDRAKAWHDEWRAGEVRSPKPQLLGGVEGGASWA